MPSLCRAVQQLCASRCVSPLGKTGGPVIPLLPVQALRCSMVPIDNLRCRRTPQRSGGPHRTTARIETTRHVVPGRRLHAIPLHHGSITSPLLPGCPPRNNTHEPRQQDGGLTVRQREPTPGNTRARRPLRLGTMTLQPAGTPKRLSLTPLRDRPRLANVEHTQAGRVAKGSAVQAHNETLARGSSTTGWGRMDYCYHHRAGQDRSIQAGVAVAQHALHRQLVAVTGASVSLPR